MFLLVSILNFSNNFRFLKDFIYVVLNLKPFALKKFRLKHQKSLITTQFILKTCFLRYLALSISLFHSYDFQLTKKDPKWRELQQQQQQQQQQQEQFPGQGSSDSQQ